MHVHTVHTVACSKWKMSASSPRPPAIVLALRRHFYREVLEYFLKYTKLAFLLIIKVPKRTKHLAFIITRVSDPTAKAPSSKVPELALDVLSMPYIARSDWVLLGNSE